MSRAEAAGLLGVSVTASPDTVRHAWRMWVRVAHPDLGGDPGHFADLVLAREVLMTPLPVAVGGSPARAPWRPRPRQPLASVLQRPAHPVALFSAALLTLALGVIPGAVFGAFTSASLPALVVLTVPAAVLATVTAVWAAHQCLTQRADRGHRIIMIAGVWVPLALLLVVGSTLMGSSVLPVLPVVTLPLVAAVASLDPGAGLWRPIGVRE